MNVAYKANNFLSAIPKRDGNVAHPKAAMGSPHKSRVTKAAVFGIIRYSKTIEELAKV